MSDMVLAIIVVCFVLWAIAASALYLVEKYMENVTIPYKRGMLNRFMIGGGEGEKMT